MEERGGGILHYTLDVNNKLYDQSIHIEHKFGKNHEKQ